jgi:hypothetical protein
VNGEIEPIVPDESAGPQSPVETLTATLHRMIDRYLRPVVVLILLWYGGSRYGASHYITRPLWENVILWPIAAIGFAVILADDLGKNKPRFSRWLARRLIQRGQRKGAYLP